ncbi:MAG: pilus assembly protein [Rhizobiales bacterium 65-9]|nr:Flp family type IVb pilin [Hyphomicrobiales bacterium]OJY37339.1 MAG: pilus assembly protein [Rhizobiales bacterium 65-9]
MSKLFARFANDESGATAVEYGLLAGLIALVIIGAVTTLGTRLSTIFTTITAGI